MNFKKTELDELFKKIKNIVDYIETSNYFERRQQIYFSNGDRITISTPNDAIAHLLGINIDYLRSTRQLKNRNSFEMLKDMCENSYTIHRGAMQGIISYDQLFSKHIYQKIEGFFDNIKIDVNDIDVVCKYNSERRYFLGELSEKYDYIIVKRYNNGKIGILGLVNNGYSYAPMSNQLYDSYTVAKEQLEKYLRNQDITLISGIKLYNVNSDYKKEFHPYLTAKEEKFNILKSYKNTFNCTIDVSGEYDFCLDKLMTRRDIDFKDNDLIDIIVNSIKQGKLIETGDVDSSLKPIIDSFNDYLCNNSSSNTQVSESYTAIKEGLEVFKTKLYEAEDTITKLEQKNECLEEQNKELENENQVLKENEQKIYEILKPRM